MLYKTHLKKEYFFNCVQNLNKKIHKFKHNEPKDDLCTLPALGFALRNTKVALFNVRARATCHHKHWVELALQHPIYGHFLMLMLLWFSLCFFNLHYNANRFSHFSHSNLQTSSWKCLMRVSKLFHIWYTFTSFWVGLNKMEQQISLCRKTFVTNMKLLMIFSIICV